MAYEKFIKKDGRLYGPYIYHSKRIDGKVVSEYHGSRKLDYKKFFLLAFGVLILVALVYFLGFSEKSTTGNAVFDLNANYQKDQPLEGELRLSLQEGELIPASSKLILENNGKNFEFNLKDVITDETISGNFYVTGAQVSGSGEGYGTPGQKKIYPKVYFTLSVLSQSDSTEEPTEVQTENSSESNTEETTTEDQPEEKTTEIQQQETPGETQEIPNEESPVTENAIAGIFSSVSNFFLGLTPTGFAVLESENEVQGQVSSGEDFKYALQQGQRAEIKPRSVKTDSKQLSEDDVQLNVQDGEIIVTTSYSEEDSGFGSDYLGSNKKEIVIDVSKLKINLTEGDLKVRLVDQGQELMSLITSIQGEGQVVAEEIVPEEQENPSDITNQDPLEVNQTNASNDIFTPPLELSEITEEERSILVAEFGNISVEAKEVILKNGFIIVRYEIGDYWIEHSYDAKLNNETLASLMEADRIKWLKDIAKTLSQEEEPEENIEGFVANYSIG